MANDLRGVEHQRLLTGIGTACSFFLRPLYEFVYPPVCTGCGTLLDSGDSKVCSRCWSSLKVIGRDDPLYLRTYAGLTSEGGIGGLISLYHFERDGILQTLVHHLKYSGMTSLGVEFGLRLGETLQKSLGERIISGILPVPLHHARKRERGYNQNDYVCRGISRVTGIPVLTNALERRRYTVSQTSLNKVERRENVSGAFRVRSSERIVLDGSTVLLVDDVITTGATVCACGKALTEVGAACVIAASIALAE